MDAGFELIEMPLDPKAGMLHEVGGQKPVDRLHHPGVFFQIAIAEPQFYDRRSAFSVHADAVGFVRPAWRTLPILWRHWNRLTSRKGDMMRDPERTASRGGRDPYWPGH